MGPMSGSSPPVNVQHGRMVSRFGVRPGRGSGTPRMHAGIDIATGRRDEPVYAVRGGTVTLVAPNTPNSNMRGYGNAIVIRSGDRYVLYAHLKDGSVTVRQGDEVQTGQQIGIIGNTTNGQFSPLPGQTLAQWQADARSRGYRASPMVPHLHMEVRRPKPDGSSPFPGPYPQSPAQATLNIDPGQWLADKGIRFSPRGGIEIASGSSAERGSALWQKGAGQTAVAGLGQGYQPPVFERDVRFGLTTAEWAALGVTGAAVLVLGAVAIVRLRNR